MPFGFSFKSTKPGFPYNKEHPLGKRCSPQPFAIQPGLGQAPIHNSHQLLVHKQLISDEMSWPNKVRTCFCSLGIVLPKKIKDRNSGSKNMYKQQVELCSTRLAFAVGAWLRIWSRPFHLNGSLARRMAQCPAKQPGMCLSCQRGRKSPKPPPDRCVWT